MGAAVCLALADREPARVRSLTLVAPAGLGQKINADVIRGLVAARSRTNSRRRSRCSSRTRPA
jgi:pyruvate dehydrogenase E2 component (dihydrolipoamide acetyltransferase)